VEFRVVRRTEHFDAAARFYRDLLGWPVSKQWPTEGDNPRGIIVAWGDSARLEFLDAPGDPVHGVSIAVEVPDVDAVVRALRAAGHAVDDPVLRPWGHRNTTTVDPSGIAVTFFTAT
jgi:catechol 2,3-dioxygenase-like lactoylglutathione lyase family enzyme